MSNLLLKKEARFIRLKRLVWFVGLWGFGVLSLGVVSFIIRTLMTMAGLHIK